MRLLHSQGGVGTTGLDRPLNRLGVRPDFGLRIAARESFWMIPKPSSIVIVNLIAKLPFLYHKPEKPALTRID